MRQTKTQKNLRPRTWDGRHSKSEAVVAREKTPPPLNSNVHQRQGGR